MDFGTSYALIKGRNGNSHCLLKSYVSAHPCVPARQELPICRHSLNRCFNNYNVIIIDFLVSVLTVSTCIDHHHITYFTPPHHASYDNNMCLFICLLMCTQLQMNMHACRLYTLQNALYTVCGHCGCM